jgi:hypothetical protein
MNQHTTPTVEIPETILSIDFPDHDAPVQPRRILPAIALGAAIGGLLLGGLALLMGLNVVRQPGETELTATAVEVVNQQATETQLYAGMTAIAVQQTNLNQRIEGLATKSILDATQIIASANLTAAGEIARLEGQIGELNNRIAQLQATPPAPNSETEVTPETTPEATTQTTPEITQEASSEGVLADGTREISVGNSVDVNLRSGPGTNFAVVARVTQPIGLIADGVTPGLDPLNPRWIRVRITNPDGSLVTGVTSDEVQLPETAFVAANTLIDPSVYDQLPQIPLDEVPTPTADPGSATEPAGDG